MELMSIVYSSVKFHDLSLVNSAIELPSFLLQNTQKKLKKNKKQ